MPEILAKLLTKIYSGVQNISKKRIILHRKKKGGTILLERFTSTNQATIFSDVFATNPAHVYVQGLSLAGDALAVPANCWLDGDSSVTGLEFASVGVDAKITIPCFNTIYHVIPNTATYTLVTNNTASIVGTFYIALMAGNVVANSGTEAAIMFNSLEAGGGFDGCTIFWDMAERVPINSFLLWNANQTSMFGLGENTTILCGTSELGQNCILMMGYQYNYDMNLYNIGFDGTNTVVGTYTTAQVGVGCGDQSNMQLVNVNVYQVSVNGTKASGLAINNVSGSSSIENCIVTYCGTAGETAGSNGIGIGAITGQSGLIISNNYCAYDADFGIMIEEQSTTKYISDYQIYQNTVIDCGVQTVLDGYIGGGICLTGTEYSQIEDNYLKYNGMGIYLATTQWLSGCTNPSSDDTIEGNIVLSSNDHGIDIPNAASTNMLVTGNTFASNGYYGAKLGSSSINFTDNMLYANVAGALIILSGAYPTLTGNGGYNVGRAIADPISVNYLVDSGSSDTWTSGTTYTVVESAKAFGWTASSSYTLTVVINGQTWATGVTTYQTPGFEPVGTIITVTATGGTITTVCQGD